MSENNIAGLKRLEALATLQVVSGMKELNVASKNQNANMSKQTNILTVLTEQMFVNINGFKRVQTAIIDMSQAMALNNQAMTGLTILYNSGQIAIGKFLQGMNDARVITQETADYESKKADEFWSNFLKSAHQMQLGSTSNNKKIKEQTKWNKLAEKGTKKLKEQGKQYAKMSGEMWLLQTTMGPFLAGLEGIMKPFQSLSTIFGSMGEILGLAFLPAVKEINQNFIGFIPTLFEWSDALTPLASGILYNATLIGLWSQATKALTSDVDLSKEALDTFNQGVGNATLKIQTFKDNVKTVFEDVNWKAALSNVATNITTALKVSVDAINWAASFADLTTAEKGSKIALALASVVNAITWSTAFGDVPSNMLKGLATSFISFTTIDWDAIATSIITGMVTSFEGQDYGEIAKTILGGLKSSLIKNKLNLSVVDVVGVVI